jgi:fructose-1,6-bisphosphatase I
MTSQPMTTLSDFLNSCQIDADLKLLIADIATSCNSISAAVRKGALANILGSAGTGNVQGETQQKLDIFANELLLKSNEDTGRLAAMASEENEVIYPTQHSDGKYLLLFDPLDGSSNIDVNVSIGTIFSILEKKSTDPVIEQDFCKQVLSKLRLVMFYMARKPS